VNAPMKPPVQCVAIAVGCAMEIRNCGAKTLRRADDGKLVKDAIFPSVGRMAVAAINLSYTAKLQPNQYVTLSIPKGKPVLAGASVSAADWFDYGTKGQGAAVTRTKEDFEFRHGVTGMFVFDLDPKPATECHPAIPYMDGAAYISALTKVFPQLADANLVDNPSSSCGDVIDTKTGAVVYSGRGTHVRFGVVNQGDLPRAFKAAHEGLMLAGHLHAFVGKNGHVMVRSIMDASLASPGRPIFGAVMQLAEGLAWKEGSRPSISERPGGLVDTVDVFKSLTDGERKELERKVKELRNHPEVVRLAGERRAEFITGHPEWAHSATPLYTSPQGHPVYQLAGGERISITGESPCVVTAAEIAADIGKWAGKSCRDPIEWDYGGDKIGIIYKRHIFSFAHGGALYKFPVRDPSDGADAWDEETHKELWREAQLQLDTGFEDGIYATHRAAFNHQYAAVNIGKNLFVLNRRALVHSNDGLHRKEAFFDNHAARKFTPAGSSKESVNLARWWFNNASRKTYDGFTLAPDNRLPGGKPLPQNFFNLWRGWSVTPDEKAGTCDRFKEYLLNTIAGGNQRLAAWLWNYLAHMVQRPWEKPGVAIVLRGAHGVGKSMLGDIMRSLVHTAHQFQTSRIDELTGQFTSHVAGKLLLQFDEATFGGDRRIMGPLKDCITRVEDKLEAKGADPIYVPSYCRVIFTSNAEVAVPIEPGERRYTVIDVPSTHKEDHAYFGALDAELEAGGRARLLWELKQTKLAPGRIRAFETTALKEHQLASLLPAEKWFLTVLLDGAVFWDAHGQPIPKSMSEIFAAASSVSREIANYGSPEALGKTLRKLGDFKQTQPRQGGGRVRLLYAPPLDDARVEFSRRKNITIDWRTGDVIGNPFS
jgi:hypothetical protein